MSGRPPFPLRPRGRPSHFASQSSDIPRAWWCRPSNCRWWEHPEDTFFSWRSIESMSNTKKGLCWDLKMDIIACPDIYNHMYIIYILQKQQNSKFHQYWGLVSCKPQISGVNSKSRLVMGGLQSWGGVRQGKMNAQQTNLSAPSPKTYTEQLTMMTMISHEFADHEFRMKYMFFFQQAHGYGSNSLPKNGLMYPTVNTISRRFSWGKPILKATTNDLRSWESKVKSPNQLFQNDKKQATNIYIYTHTYMFS